MAWAERIVELLSVLMVVLALALAGVRMFRDLVSRPRDAEDIPEGEAEPGEPATEAPPVPARLSAVKVTALTLANRAVVFVIGYLVFLGITDKKAGFLDSFKTIWSRWDGVHYLNLAQNWYRGTGEDRVLIAFYPLYPIAIRIAHLAIPDYFWAAVAVSLVCLVAASYFLQELVRLEVGDGATARDAVKYMLIFPLSFFFAIAYTESLFLLLTVLAFYFCRRDRWLAAGIAGLLAALTRNVGALLVLPLVIELAYGYRQRGTSLRRTMSRAACVLLVPVGTGLYLLLNKVVTGDWFKFMEYQKGLWCHDFVFFGANLATMVPRIFEPNVRLAVGTWLSGVAFFFFALLVVILAARALPPSYTIYSVAYLVTAYSVTWLLGGARYIAGMFPLFVGMALMARGHPVRRHVMDLASALGLGFMIAMFIQSAVY